MIRLFFALIIAQVIQAFQVTHISDCGKTRGCWMLPPGCSNQETCSVMVTWKHEGRSLKLELESELKSQTSRWIGFGLSKDKRMGNDTVFECHFPSSGQGSVHLSHNAQTNNMILNKASSLLLKDSYAEINNGRALCGAEWFLDKTIVLDNEKKLIHPLSQGKYHLFFATGDLTQGSKKAHAMAGAGSPWKSVQSVRFCKECTSAFKIVS
ncbi:unnamed protein product [Auanema sp. JU1783]|nr:unnamed protein product [Auanema sp. JU1783]